MEKSKEGGHQDYFPVSTNQFNIELQNAILRGDKRTIWNMGLEKAKNENKPDDIARFEKLLASID